MPVRFEYPHWPVARLEAAIEALGFRIAAHAATIEAERRKPTLDTKLIAALRERIVALRDEQDDLRPGDTARIAAILGRHNMIGVNAMKNSDLRQAPAGEAAADLRGTTTPSMGQLQAALINALERIASLEKDRDEFLQACQLFNEQIAAAKLHGTGLLNEQ